MGSDSEADRGGGDRRMRGVEDVYSVFDGQFSGDDAGRADRRGERALKTPTKGEDVPVVARARGSKSAHMEKSSHVPG
jgi:hypothetical protein